MEEKVDLLISRFFIKPRIKENELFDGYIEVEETHHFNQDMIARYDQTFQPNFVHFYLKSRFDKSSRYWVRIDLTKRFSKRRLGHIKVALEDMLDGSFEDFERREV